MYIEDFEAFYEQAVELYRAKPLQTRYSIKFRHSEGKLVLKVTDDHKVRTRAASLRDDLQSAVQRPMKPS